MAPIPSWFLRAMRRRSAGFGPVFGGTLAYDCRFRLQWAEFAAGPPHEFQRLAVSVRPVLGAAHTLFFREHLFTNPMQLANDGRFFFPVSQSHQRTLYLARCSRTA